MDIKKVNGLNSLNEEGSKWAIMDVLLESTVFLFGQSKYPNIRWFWTIFCHKTRVFSLQKVQKKNSFEYNGYNIYLTKAKSRTLSLFIKNTQV